MQFYTLCLAVLVLATAANALMDINALAAAAATEACKLECAAGEAEAESVDVTTCQQACEPAGAAQVYASVVCMVGAAIATLF